MNAICQLCKTSVSRLSDQLSVLADIWMQLSAIGLSAKIYIGTSLLFS